MGTTPYFHKYLAVDKSFVDLVNFLGPIKSAIPLLPEFNCGDLAKTVPFTQIASA